ncbi:MAG: hypothetical protein RJB66_1489 [Pseudomonadota bacterium]|jgi:signal transduction histidine kinase
MNYAKINRAWDLLGFQQRLTICLSGVFAVILAIGYWSLFLEFQGELQNDFDRSLYNYASDLSQNAHLNGGEVADLPMEVIFGADKIFPFPHGDSLVKIYHLPSTELFSFTTDHDAPKNLEMLTAFLKEKKERRFFDLKSEGGHPWRAILMQFNKDPKKEIYFFVAVPRETLTHQETKFRSIFIAGQIIILALSALMINVLAKSLLASLARMTTNIHSMPINTSNFSFEVPSGPPEITLFAELLNRLIGQIQKSLLAHQEFVAKAAHQLKTPLTIAKGHLEHIEKSLPLKHLNDIKVVHDEIDIMSGTINNLLTLVQIESGFQGIRPTEVNFLDHLLAEVDRLDYLARKKDLKFQVVLQDQDLSPAAWVTQIDPQLLSIILTNLIENAIKYANQSPLEIDIANADTAFVLQIKNKTNLQMAGSSILQLKEKYIRGNGPETGQGLGLYIAYTVANFLNIKLSIDQQVDTFIVNLQIPKSHT